MEQNQTFGSVPFIGDQYSNGILVKNQEGYVTRGGIVASANTQTAYFGRVASYLPADPTNIFVGFPTGNEVFAGVFARNPGIGENNLAAPDYYKTGLPCLMDFFGMIQNQIYTKVASGATDPVPGCIVIAKNDTGVIEFLPATASSIPTGYTQIPASVFVNDSMANGVSIFIGINYATPLTAASNRCAMKSFAIVVTGATGFSAEGNIVESTGAISITVPAGTTVTALKAQFVVSDNAIVKISTTTQTSGVTANDFTSPVTYVVTAADGSTTKSYVVTVTVHS